MFIIIAVLSRSFRRPFAMQGVAFAVECQDHPLNSVLRLVIHGPYMYACIVLEKGRISLQKSSFCALPFSIQVKWQPVGQGLCQLRFTSDRDRNHRRAETSPPPLAPFPGNLARPRQAADAGGAQKQGRGDGTVRVRQPEAGALDPQPRAAPPRSRAQSPRSPQSPRSTRSEAEGRLGQRADSLVLADEALVKLILRSCLVLHAQSIGNQRNRPKPRRG